MNKNILALILIIISVALATTFTWPKYQDLEQVMNKNSDYEKAVENYLALIKARDKIQEDYRSVSVADIDEKLEKMIPDHIDNVRLIIDVKSIIEKYGIKPTNITASTPDDKEIQAKETAVKKPLAGATQPSVVTLSFNMTTTYKTMEAVLKEIERSLRILDISRINFSANDVKEGQYDFSIELKTYWLRK